MPSSKDTDNALLAKAHELRRAAVWDEASIHYQRHLRAFPNDLITKHNLSLCLLAKGDAIGSYELACRVYAEDPSLWQSGLIIAQSLQRLGDRLSAIEWLDTLRKEFPDISAVELAWGRLMLQHGGHAEAARECAQRVAAQGDQPEAELIGLAASFYDRPEGQSAKSLSDAIIRWVEHRWYKGGGGAKPKPSVERSTKQKRLTVRRPRVGLLSPQFHTSPIYFFSFGALSRLQHHWNLVFLDRGSRRDWSREAFERIAAEWDIVDSLDSEILHRRIKSHNFDVLIDMGGWMDAEGLRSLIGRPAKRQFKWVGGQSATTGLRCFDGFLTDQYQSPLGSESLHSEPLIRMSSGYVSYTAPTYLPTPSEAPSEALWQIGLIANPSKLSTSFLIAVSRFLDRWQQEQAALGLGLSLYFIDSRYQSKKLQQRIKNFFKKHSIFFITPSGHRSYLDEVSKLHAVIDTYPYSGGLTTVEAMMLGVPTFTWKGKLFSERHSSAHNLYAGFGESDLQVDALPGDLVRWRKARPLLDTGSPRLDHDGVANSLLGLMRG